MPEDQMPFAHFEPVGIPPVVGIRHQAAIKTAATRLFELLPAEDVLQLVYRGFMVTIERGDFFPPDEPPAPPPASRGFDD